MVPIEIPIYLLLSTVSGPLKPTTQVRKQGDSLQFASPELQRDEGIVLLAVPGLLLGDVL